VVLSYWNKTKRHSSLDSALHKIAWYDPESLATKKSDSIFLDSEVVSSFCSQEVNECQNPFMLAGCTHFLKHTMAQTMLAHMYGYVHIYMKDAVDQIGASLLMSFPTEPTHSY
jgi:hypothetical protein